MHHLLSCVLSISERVRCMMPIAARMGILLLQRGERCVLGKIEPAADQHLVLGDKPGVGFEIAAIAVGDADAQASGAAAAGKEDFGRQGLAQAVTAAGEMATGRLDGADAPRYAAPIILPGIEVLPGVGWSAGKPQHQHPQCAKRDHVQADTDEDQPGRGGAKCPTISRVQSKKMDCFMHWHLTTNKNRLAKNYLKKAVAVHG